LGPEPLCGCGGGECAFGEGGGQSEGRFYPKIGCLFMDTAAAGKRFPFFSGAAIMR
jgi:hypothetical protein